MEQLISFTPFEQSFIHAMKNHYPRYFDTMSIPQQIITTKYTTEWYRNVLARLIHHFVNNTFSRHNKHRYSSCHPCLTCHQRCHDDYISYCLYDLTLIEVHLQCESLLLSCLNFFLISFNGVPIETLFPKYIAFRSVDLIDDVIQHIGYQFIAIHR